MNSEVQLWTVPEDRAGQRIDNLLMARLKGVPRSRIYRMLRKGEVRVNKRRCKADYRVEAGDLIRIPPVELAPEKRAPSIPRRLMAKIERSIIAEGDGWIALNKPSGVAVHGGSGLQFGVIEVLRAIPGLSKTSIELVHRLDRDTSGILLIATKRSRLRWLHQQLRQGTMRKTYQCIVHGRWPREVQSVDFAIVPRTRTGGERIMKAVAATTTEHAAKPALTHYRLIAQRGQFAWLEAMPVTGRTHQIRVHCAAMGCPIIGDDKYRTDKHLKEIEKSKGIDRLGLHAWKLSFLEKENGNRIEICADLPELWRTLGGAK